MFRCETKIVEKIHCAIIIILHGFTKYIEYRVRLLFGVFSIRLVFILIVKLKWALCTKIVPKLDVEFCPILRSIYEIIYDFFQLHLSTPSQEFNREEAESQRRIMDGSPPTPRSLRLDPSRGQGHHLSASQEELRR